MVETRVVTKKSLLCVGRTVAAIIIGAFHIGVESFLKSDLNFLSVCDFTKFFVHELEVFPNQKSKIICETMLG